MSDETKLDIWKIHKEREAKIQVENERTNFRQGMKWNSCCYTVVAAFMDDIRTL